MFANHGPWMLKLRITYMSFQHFSKVASDLCKLGSRQLVGPAAINRAVPSAFQPRKSCQINIGLNYISQRRMQDCVFGFCAINTDRPQTGHIPLAGVYIVHNEDISITKKWVGVEEAGIGSYRYSIGIPIICFS